MSKTVLVQKTWPMVARWSFAAAVLVFTALALLPGDRLPSVFNWWDKAQHALAFAVLAMLAWSAWPAVTAWRWAVALVGYGVLIELAQAATGWRHGDAADAFADAVGVAVGLAMGFGRRWRRAGGSR